MTEIADPVAADPLKPLHPGLRVYVDQSQHPIHDDVQSMGARLLLDDGQIAEVQIARIGDTLNVVIAGATYVKNDARGNLLVGVTPTPKETK